MNDDLLESIVDGVATLTMNRPRQLNSLTSTMRDAMVETLSRLASDPQVAVVILTGSGNAFCAGGDIQEMADGTEFAADTLEGKADLLRQQMESARLLHDMQKPTIAMVRGAAAGAGLSLALACDLRIASETAKFITAFTRVGYSGDFGGSYYLTRLIGTGKARELYYTSDLITAGKALELGMVNRVVPDTELEQETMELAKRLAKGPLVAFRYIKRNMNAAETGTLKEVLDLEAWHHTRCGMTEDHLEASQAFIEKREARFRGR